MISQNIFDKKIIAKNFSNAARNYDEFALIQKQVAQRISALTSPFIKQNSQILDLGSGTGFVASNLSQLDEFLKNYAKIYEVDLSLEMLKNRPNRHKNIFPLCCDIENLSFKKASFDLLVSSFSLQWLQNFEKTFTEFYQILKPGGSFIFAIPNQESLPELKIASAESGCNFNFNTLPNSQNIRSILRKSGFEEKEFYEEILKSEFNSAVSAVKSLKIIGANYQSKRNFISKKRLEDFNNICFKNYLGINETISKQKLQRNSDIFKIPQQSSGKKITISWNISYFIFSK